jgi:sarcosine oxidase subunit beta
MNPNYDVIVIGAGIMGCSSAFQLASRGLKVGVLEKAGLGAGSTGKSSAIIRQHYSNEITARMALHSLRVFQDFREAVGGEAGFRQTGFLVLTPEKDLEGLQANVELQQRVGIDTSLLTGQEIRDRWPYLAAGDLVAAAFEPESGYADPNLTIGGYSEAAKRVGATFHLETEVTGLSFKSETIQAVDTTVGEFHAPLIVNCAGPWGAHIASMAELQVPIDSCRVQVALFQRPKSHQAEHPVVADFTHSSYWRPETGGLTLVGLIDPVERDDVVDPDRYNERVDLDFVADIGNRLVQRFPAMENSHAAHGYAAVYAITPDWHPIIDEALEGSGFYICAGFSGHGFKLGPAVGVMVADMLTGDQTEGLERGIFRLGRFEEGRPISGRYEYSIAG